MPTIQSMELPVPKNWQDFETLVRDAQAERWQSPTLQKNGRPGQKQDGVDIYGPDGDGKPVGIQCKRYKSLKLNVITQEVKNAEAFSAPLTTLFIATTTDHDAKLQAEVRSISKSREKGGKFGVAILFWEDIVASLLLNPHVFQSHYPQVRLPKPSDDKDRLLAALELGYKGADLWAYIRLIYGEYGWLAQTDPDELHNNLQILKTKTRFLIPPEHAAPIVEALEHALAGCKKPKTEQSDWDLVEIHAKRASMRLLRAASLLPMAESNMLKLGAQLGQIYHHVDDLPAEKIRGEVELRLRNILPPSSRPAIESWFLEASSLDDGYRWALRIYSLVEREIRFIM